MQIIRPKILQLLEEQTKLVVESRPLVFSLKKTLYLLLFCFNTTLFAQVFGELLPGSSQLIYDEKTGIHKLLDGANFLYQGNTLYCDSAFYFDATKTIRAYGHVHIRKREDINLFCDSLCFYTETGMVDLWGNVRAMNQQYRLLTDSMSYDTKNEQGIYRDGGKVENLLQKEEITSRIGHFIPRKNTLLFSHQVVYFSDEIELTTDSLHFNYDQELVHFFGETCIVTDQATIEAQRGWYNTHTLSGNIVHKATITQNSRTIKGDSLIYLAPEKIAQGFGNVAIYDTLDKMEFRGHYALINDSLQYSLLTDQARAIKYQQNDTINIFADTLYNRNDTLGKSVFTHAYHGVKLFSSSIQGIGDSLVYEKPANCIELFKNPILWAKNGELKGDSMHVHIDDSLLYEAQINGKSTVIMQLDSGTYYNQVGGNQLTVYFENNQLKIARVIGNAQTVFFPEEIETIPDSLQSDRNIVQVKRLGMNRFYASDISVFFDSGEVVGITYYKNPDGIFYPMEQILEKDQYIQHFEVSFALRPKSLEEIENTYKLRD